MDWAFVADGRCSWVATLVKGGGTGMGDWFTTSETVNDEWR